MTGLLHEVFDTTCARTPDAVAIVQGPRSVTYAQLDRAARLVERRLTGGRLTGVTASVTIESVAAVLAILRSGRAYVPLDVHSPPDRLDAILDDAGIELAVLDPSIPVVKHLHYAGARSLLGEETDQPWEGPERAAPATFAAVCDDLAYVLYTSGSTGVPKGVMLSHRNARTFVDWMAREFEVDSRDRVMSRSPLNYDLSVFDIFNAFAAGATLVIDDRRVDLEIRRPAEVRHRSYVDAIVENRASILYTTPSTLLALLDKGALDRARSLRLLLYAGEPFPPAQLGRLMRRMPWVRVANIYGPTETNIVTYHWVREPPGEGDEVPIGVEVDDTHIIIVDDAGRPCAAGQSGEIWVRGGTVCLGYLGRPELTAERAVQSPVHPYPALFWRTGDYGYRRPDGEIVYQGRIDNMVKVRGHRIELGDIEAAAGSHGAVGHAVAVPVAYADGIRIHLLAVPADDGTPLCDAELGAHLAQRLPETMLPWRIEVRSDLPSTSTGKVDRQRLKRELEQGS